MKGEAAKGVIGLISYVLGYLYNCMNVLTVFLGLFILSDYVLGLLADLKKGKHFDKKKAIWGAIKKVLYGWILVLAFSADYILRDLTSNAGIDIPVKSVIGIGTLCYLLGTELLSNGRNLIILGAPVPKFLMSVFGLIKDQGGNIVQIPKKAESEAK